MEDQGKRLLLAVAIAFVLLWGWSILFPSKAPEKDPEAEDAAEKAESSESAEKAKVVAETPETPPPTSPRGEEQVVTFTFDQFVVELSSYGGALKSWTLTGSQFEDRRVSPTVPLELVPTTTLGSEYYTMQFSLGEGPLAEMATGEWDVAEKTSESITFRWDGEGLTITKKFTFDPTFFLVDLRINVSPKGAGESKHTPTLSLFGFQDPKEDAGGGMTRLPREWKAACLVGDDLKQKSAKDLLKESSRRDGAIRWGGFAHSFFVVGSALEQSSGRVDCDSTAVAGHPGAMRVDMRFPKIVASGSPYTRRVVSYLGPNFVGALEQASKKSGFNPGFEEAVDLGWLGFISGPLLWLLTIFQRFVINWGVAIVCLTVVIKLLLLPLTHKSIKSMKGMSKLRPQMEKLKEKYGDDKQKLQVETMNLFKTHGVNPLAGCLPMVLQMPIWFALYRMLMAAAELYQVPFIPGWIDDLTAPDPVFVLPIAVTILMFFQTKLTPTTATGMQMKVMMYGMPIMFGFFSLFFPAGLTLYIFTNTALTLVHYFFVHKEDRASAKADKIAKKVAKAAGIDLDDSDGEDSDDSDSDASSNDESADEESSANKNNQSSSKSEARPRKSGKGSRGGKRGGKKKKKKKKGAGI